jgi:hypothetical protein
VVPVEQHQKSADRWRQQQQPVLREGIRMQLSTTILNTNEVLVLLVISVERGKVDIRGGLVDVHIAVGSSEDAVQLLNIKVTCEEDRRTCE